MTQTDKNPKIGDWIETPQGDSRKKIVDVPDENIIALNDGWGPYAVTYSDLIEEGWKLIPQDE